MYKFRFFKSVTCNYAWYSGAIRVERVTFLLLAGFLLDEPHNYAPIADLFELNTLVDRRITPSVMIS